jgi:hypothetical protein
MGWAKKLLQIEAGLEEWIEPFNINSMIGIFIIHQDY